MEESKSKYVRPPTEEVPDSGGYEEEAEEEGQRRRLFDRCRGSLGGEDEDEYVLEVHSQQTKHTLTSARSATLNLLNNVVGGGVLALPFALRSSGLIVGSILLTTVALLCVLSCHLLLDASRYVEDKSYTGLARATAGRRGAIFSDLCNFLFLFGALTGYMIILGDVLLPFTGWLGFLHQRWFVVGVIGVVALLPLCLLRKIGALTYASLAALGCVVYLVVLVAFRSIKNLVEESLEESEHELTLANMTPDIFRSLPIMSFAFTFHPNVFPIFSEMRKPTMTRMQNVVHVAVLLSGVAYLVVGVFGYLTFLENTEGNLFNNYDDELPIQIGKILLAIVIIFSYPIIHFPARIALDSIVLEAAPQSPRVPDIRVRYVAITLCILAVSYVLSIVIPDIAFVFGLIGATAGNLIVYTGPGLIYFKLAPGSLRDSPKKVGAATLAIVGVLFGLVSVVVICYDQAKKVV